MANPKNTVVVNQTTTIIQSGAFRDMFSSALAELGQNSSVDLEFNIGSGNVIIESEAFKQEISGTALPNGITINSATMTFNPQSQPTLGANAMSGLPVRNLTLPAQTTLQANALQGLTNLQLLDASLLVNPLATNSMNLERSMVVPLIVLMPSSPSATFSTNSVVIPQSAAGSSTTLVFDGHIPTSVELAEMFAFQSQTTTPAAVQVSVNFSTTSTAETEFQALVTGLTLNQGATPISPALVPFNQLQTALQQLQGGGAQNLQPAGALTSLSQFAGDYFDYVILAPKVNIGKALKQCVVTSLSASAKASNVQNIPIPSAITPLNSTPHNVVGLVPHMTIAGTQFFIIDNYFDPSDTSLTGVSVPLVAIFSKDNAAATAGTFFPALVCNGTIAVVNGVVTVSGPRGTGANKYCQGYNARPTQDDTPNVAADLLNGPVGSTVQLYNRSQSSNINPIASIFYNDANTFTVQFNPDNAAAPIMGCMEKYIPSGENAAMVADFTNQSDAGNAAWFTFSARVATLIANNNALTTLLNQIQAQSVPAGVTGVTKPTPKSISDELTALSKSDFNAAFTAWDAVDKQYTTNYSAHLAAMVDYVNNVIFALDANSAPEYVNARTAFIQFQSILASPTSSLAKVRNDLDNAKIYTEAVSGYINARLSIGLQTFKGCTNLIRVHNFEYLRNISKIHDESFSFCNAINFPIIIPVNVVSIGVGAFQHCTGITSIDIQGAIALRDIGDSAFESCQNANGLHFSSAIYHNQPSVERIGNSAFKGCAKLTGHIYFPHGLKSLGVSAFSGCSGLNGTIVFPRNVNFTAISDSAFEGCSSLTGISTNTGNGSSLEYTNLPEYGADAGKPVPNGLIIPVNITQIGAKAFLGCSRFAGALNLQQSPASAIASIGNAAFSGCSAFTSLVLPNVLTTVAIECFKGCSGITNLVLPNNVKNVLANAFENCNKIAKVPKLDNLNTIGNSAFYNCAEMVGALVLGANLNVLGDRAFFKCGYLTSATFLGPPPSTLKNSILIFGTDSTNVTTPFYVNVFTENGWNGTDLNGVNIQTAFRAKQANGSSKVKMAFIDFSTFVPAASPREITINKYETFKVYENDIVAATGNVASTDPNIWNDVYIPETLAGESLIAAQSNVNQAPLLQSQMTARITPNVDAVKTAALDMSLSANPVLNALDASVVVVRQTSPGTPIRLNKVASLPTTINTPSSDWYGVHTNAGVDSLYYAPAGTNGNPTLLTSSVVFIGARSFFVDTDAADNAFRTKYNHKVIRVGNDGKAFVSSNVTAIGYGASNQPTAVQYTTVQPKTDRTGLGYSIVKSTVAGVPDKLYFDTLIAAAGTYFVSNVSVAETVAVADAPTYQGVIIEVREDGSVHRMVDSRSNRFVVVDVANAANVGAITNVGQYGIITNPTPQSGANTQYQLFRKVSAAVAAVAPAGHYYIKSSGISQLNNAIVLVHPNGGITVESVGASGAVSRVEDHITLLAAEAIPIFSTNESFQNATHAVNVFERADSSLFTSNQALKEANTRRLFTALNNEMRSDIQNAIVGQAGTIGTSFRAAFNDFNTNNEGLTDKYNNYTNKSDNYANAIRDFNDVFVGSDTSVGLQKIQANTLSNARGIYAFRRNATFNSGALNVANSPALDGWLDNDLPYITAQMQKFLTEILKMQYNNKFPAAGLDTLFSSVKDNVSFQESPTVNATPRMLTYNNLSTQQRILFDHVANCISIWLNSGTTDEFGVPGGQKSWGESISPTSKLYATNGTDAALDAALLAWGEANIMNYFKKNNVSVYQQFMNNVANISSFVNIRVSISAYEDARTGGNDSVANTNAKRAYVNNSKVNVLALNQNNAITFDNDPSEPTGLLANGKLRFNRVDQTAATKLFISLKDGQEADISFAGYADTIRMNENITFKINAITKNTFCYILDVTYVAETGTANSISGPQPLTSIITYQNASVHTLGAVTLPAPATLADMNTFVYDEYNIHSYHVSNNTRGIKAALLAAKNELKAKEIEMAEAFREMNDQISQVVQKSSALNAAEDNLMASLHATPATGTTLALNGARILHREAELLQIALQPTVNLPVVGTLPTHEAAWMQSRVAAFWADGSLNAPAQRLTVYTTADAAFNTARFARQQAAIASYVANTLPTQSIASPVSTKVVSEQAMQFAKSMPVFVQTNNEAVARLISASVSGYVLGRKLATSLLNGDALTAATTQYQEARKKEAAEAMTVANAAYGTALYNRYIALIDLAISRAYHAGLDTHPVLSIGATNAFQTFMQQWNVASNTIKPQVFEQIKPLLYNMVYTTDATGTYTTSFPLKDNNNANISWFGDNQNGFLNRIIDNGLTFARNTSDQLTGLNFASYDLPSSTSVTVSGVPYTLTTPNQVTIPAVGGTVYTLVTAGALVDQRDNSAAVSAATFNASLRDAAARSSVNPLNVSAAQAAANLIASAHYDVANIGYASLPSGLSDADMSARGFSVAGGVLNFTSTVDESNRLRYQFQSGNTWHFGYKQSSSLASSWKKLSSAQDVVVFYPGTTDVGNVPANLYEASQSVTSMCDDASFVMILEPVVGSITVQTVSIYRYDVWGVNSGALIAVGTLTQNPSVQTLTPNLYTVIGALQNDISNSSVGMVGSLVISNKVKTIGICAFSGLNINSLSIANGGAVDIGANAFESCSLLSTINLSASVKSIGPSAFLKCTGAASLALPPSSTTSYFTVNHWSFLGCSGIANDVQLPSNLVQINVQAFARCNNLKCSQLNESLPASVQRIGLGAFFNCKGLTGSLKFNNVNQNGKLISSIRVLGSAAFMGCTGLNGDLVLSDHSEYLRVLPYTFASMDAPVLTIGEIQLNQPVPADAAPMALTGNVDFSLSSVTAIDRNAFHKCNKLSAIKLSNVISDVGIQSFLGCSGLNQLLLVPASVKSIGKEAFKSCSGLTGLNIVSTVVSQSATEAWLSLGKSCFQDCTALAAGNNGANGIIIPNSVNSVGDSSFQGCTSLEGVLVGSGLTKANSFGTSVFSGCVKLARVTFAFSFLSRDISGQSVVKDTQFPNYNASFSGCTALGVPSDTPIGTIQIQSGAVGWTPGRALFFNNLTIVINNKNITFYLKEFNELAKINVVDPSTEPLQQEAIPPTDAQATVHIKASDMRKVFLTSTDSYVAQDVDNQSVDRGQLFFVRPDYFPQYLNVANAHVVQGGIESYNAAIYEQLVKDDVMRYYAMSLFNSADWVTLFANDTEMLENMVASSGLMPIVPDGNYDDVEKRNLYNTGVLYNIMKELNNVGYIKTSTVVNPNDKRVQSTNYPATGTKWWGLPDTVLPEQGNIGKKLFALINRNDPNRISSMVLNGSTPSELPFLPGDQFVFIFTLKENSVSLTPGLPPVVVKPRTYLIKMILTDDFVSGDASFTGHFNALYNPSPRNLNILPVSGAYAADYMYSNYNLQLAIKPSVLNQTVSSVYSRITQNAFEPIPMPVNLLPFTGWYYSYPYNSQTIRLDFTPPDISLTNRFVYNDLKYLSAYVYFPENWSSVSVLPAPDNFPQWVLTFFNGARNVTLKCKAGYLPTAGSETVNFLGQTVPFDYANTHVQLICPFEMNTDAQTALIPVLNGVDANGAVGAVNTIAGSYIYRQKSSLNLVSGLRNNSSKIGPFTYPPIARGYQGINVSTASDKLMSSSGISQNDITDLKSPTTTYSLTSIYLEINMSNNNGFVPSVIMKSVEVVAKNYEAYYLAPLDPN